MRENLPAQKLKETCYAYLLQCGDGSLYAGWTNHLEQRLRSHQAGRGGKYTRSRLPVALVYSERFDTRHEAMHREWELKHMTRAQKLALVRPEKQEERSADDGTITE